MNALVARARRGGRAALLGAAGRVGSAFNSLPEAAGALLLSFGLGQMYRPLLWCTLGVFCLATGWKRARGGGDG